MYIKYIIAYGIHKSKYLQIFSLTNVLYSVKIKSNKLKGGFKHDKRSSI